MQREHRGPVENDAQEPILLDTCCLLNLCASRRIDEILGTLPAQFSIVSAVSGEALYVFRGGEGNDARQRDLIDLTPLITGGLLAILRVETDEEMASYVRFAVDLDDGEAMTCALALHRGASVATDDRKTLRILAALSPPITAYTTASLIKHWAESKAIGPAGVKQVLMDIQQRGRFLPGSSDPLRGWWQAIIKGE